MTTVTLVTRARCAQCTATKRHLERRGVPYDVLDLTDDPTRIEQLRAEGHMQLPVVTGPTGTWTGYRPDRLDELATHQRQSPTERIVR